MGNGQQVQIGSARNAGARVFERTAVRGRKWWVPRWILVLVALATVVLGCGSSHDWEGWLTTIEEGIEVSNATKKPMLVLFTAEWCGSCKQLEGQVLSDAGVKRKLRDEFVLVQVDLTEHQGPNNMVAQEYGVQFIPAVMVFGPGGKLLGDSGGRPAPQFSAWLDECLAMAGR